MGFLLEEISQAIAPGVHAVVLLDAAGWHIAHALIVQDNLTLLSLSPRSPGLNAGEKVRQFLRDRFPVHQVFKDAEHIIDACFDSCCAV